jgi:hypothetical protein
MLYSNLRGYEIDDFVTSLDGLNFKPPIEPFHVDDDKNDWAHVDQTFKGIHDCIQGQVVLSDTSAGFRASSRSHLLHDNILDDFDANGKYDNFFKFKSDDYDNLKQRIENIWRKVAKNV